MAGQGELRAYLASVITQAQPPESPIVEAGWAGIAFDRNLHEDLAPTDVWEAWLAVHRDLIGPDSALCAESFMDLEKGACPELLPPRLEALRRYWSDDARFLRDHYVVSRESGFVVRLDQDVTLFVAKVSFLSEVVDRLGGLGSVMARMIDDFDPGETDPVGLQRYLDAIVAPLIR